MIEAFTFAALVAAILFGLWAWIPERFVVKRRRR